MTPDPNPPGGEGRGGVHLEEEFAYPYFTPLAFQKYE